MELVSLTLCDGGASTVRSIGRRCRRSMNMCRRRSPWALLAWGGMGKSSGHSEDPSPCQQQPRSANSRSRWPQQRVQPAVAVLLLLRRAVGPERGHLELGLAGLARQGRRRPFFRAAGAVVVLVVVDVSVAVVGGRRYHSSTQATAVVTTIEQAVLNLERRVHSRKLAAVQRSW